MHHVRKGNRHRIQTTLGLLFSSFFFNCIFNSKNQKVSIRVSHACQCRMHVFLPCVSLLFFIYKFRTKGARCAHNYNISHRLHFVSLLLLFSIMIRRGCISLCIGDEQWEEIRHDRLSMVFFLYLVFSSLDQVDKSNASVW